MLKNRIQQYPHSIYIFLAILIYAGFPLNSVQRKSEDYKNDLTIYRLSKSMVYGCICSLFSPDGDVMLLDFSLHFLATCFLDR